MSVNITSKREGNPEKFEESWQLPDGTILKNIRERQVYYSDQPDERPAISSGPNKFYINDVQVTWKEYHALLDKWHVER